MCQVCASLRPFDPTCPYRSPDSFQPVDGTDAVSNTLPVFTYDQIADQLNSGYWGGNSYAFDVAPGGSLTVDLAGLTEKGQEMARLALDAWTDATGIIFEEVSSNAPSSTVFETTDAASGTGTAYTVQVGEDFDGALSTAADADTVAVNLSAGDRITLVATPDDPDQQVTVRLLSGRGTVLQEADGRFGHEATIAYEVSSSGTYYIEVSGAEAATYTLAVRDIRTNSDITFDDEASGAFAQFWTSGDTITRSSINIDDNWAGGQSRIDGYYFQTYLHEIGHALGLGHSGNYNGSARYPNDANYLNDSWQASVMSYFYQTENTFIDASFAYVITPQVADLIAIHELYGIPDVRTGDDTYGDNATSGSHTDGSEDLSNPVSYTVFDTGGTDTFDFSSYSNDQVMDLREEAFSDLAGLDGNIGIGRGTVIEYGLTGEGDDVLIGNDFGNGLTALGGADTLDGGGGDDALAGGEGIDRVIGSTGRDMISGGDEGDFIDGGAESDLLIGDDVDLVQLIEAFPDWTPPPDAADLLADGDLLALWEGIVDDVFSIA